MTPQKRITLAEVRASINSDLEIHPSATYFGRPLANQMTPFFHNRGWNANHLTIVRTFIAFAGVFLLAFPLPILWQISAVIFYLCFVLDYVDGNLARIQNDASYLGKFLDGIADGIYPLTAAFFLGIGTWLYYDEPLLLILGGLISIVSLCNQMVRNRLSFFREWMVGLTGELTEQDLENAEKPREIQRRLALVTVNGYFVAIVGLMIPDWGAAVFFGFCLCTQTLPEAMWIATSMAEAGALLKRGRISRLARIISTEGQD
jgi:phosphatidylglycerophosphate synthase